MTLITDQPSLAAFCARMRGERFVAIDTEFMRDRTYYPKLCLVQVAGAGEAVAIDPLAPGLDLAPLLAVLADPGVLKVMHAARQDLEIFFHLGQLPAPFFDTQVAAMVCGFGEEVAYDTLVSKLAGAHLDKSSRFTDWARRPLSEAQIRYALGDVTHLRVIYEKLAARIEKAGRMGWVAEELAGPARPRALQPAARGGLAPAQAALARRPLRRHRPGAGGLARARGAAPRPAARPRSSATTC